MKRELTLESIFKKSIEPYRSILNLLIRFQKHGKEEGLKQSHFRYALMRNHGDLNPYLMEEMRRFYLGRESVVVKDYLNPFIESGYITPNCVTSRSNLSNKLKRLLDMGVIYKDQRGKKDRYKITRDCRLKGLKVTHLKGIDDFKNLYAYKENGVVYGLSRGIFYKLSKEDGSRILRNLEDIDSKLKEIEKIKQLHMLDVWFKILDSKGVKDKSQYYKDTIKRMLGDASGWNELDYKLLELLKEYEIINGIAFSWSVPKHPNPLEELNTTSI
jgi:hypothetical protein